MKLWLLKPKDDLVNGPWEPWFDTMFGIVVRSETAQEARQIAHDNGEEENYHDDESRCEPWLNPKLSTCVELLLDRNYCTEGKPGVILRDVHAAR